ncbi:unnamed protein product [Medioppia subpectinata]|uniref:Uncharacterized protein n=1 Tax=Medioppia subpectinata TaxID=1979941 RepID=A0A7R9Q039_9ACAR|nr:unnamed protein product [Medioppia subpectinata]CAG2106825.1 unnamed protein product [Medioppia subpectinata]
MRDFATEYIKTIVSSALETLNSQPIDIDKCLIKTSRSDNQCFESGQWMSRIRQVFTRLMRSACLCKSKHQFRHRKS